MTRYDWWSFVGATAVTGSTLPQLRQKTVPGRRSGPRERRPTSNEIRPQLALSQVVRSDVAVNRARHYVRWTDVNGLDGVFGLLQGLDGLTALSSG